MATYQAKPKAALMCRAFASASPDNVHRYIGYLKDRALRRSQRSQSALSWCFLSDGPYIATGQAPKGE